MVKHHNSQIAQLREIAWKTVPGKHKLRYIETWDETRSFLQRTSLLLLFNSVSSSARFVQHMRPPFSCSQIKTIGTWENSCHAELEKDLCPRHRSAIGFAQENAPDCQHTSYDHPSSSMSCTSWLLPLSSSHCVRKYQDVDKMSTHHHLRTGCVTD